MKKDGACHGHVSHSCVHERIADMFQCQCFSVEPCDLSGRKSDFSAAVAPVSSASASNHEHGAVAYANTPISIVSVFVMPWPYPSLDEQIKSFSC